MTHIVTALENTIAEKAKASKVDCNVNTRRLNMTTSSMGEAIAADSDGKAKIPQR